MTQRLQFSISSLILVGLLACTQTGSLVKTAPVWLERDPILPGYFIAIGMQSGGENPGEMAAQHARETLSKQLQPEILTWMEANVVNQGGSINEDQSFRLKQMLPSVLDELMMATLIEDEYEKDGKYWVLLKLQQELARKLVSDKLARENTLQP